MKKLQVTDQRLEEILVEVKEKLYVTWSEDDVQLKNTILRACRYIQTKVSQSLLFESESLEYDLLLERCRYDWNSALDEFEKNYASEMLAFIQAYALKDWRESHGTDQRNL